ncbi:DUF3613 domain-containing protein [Achromobacter insuavis]
MPARPVVQQVQTPMPQAAAQPAPQPAAEAPEAFGDITRGLLAAQAGRRAAALPVLGAASTAAWNRYVDSFTRPIPGGSPSGCRPTTLTSACLNESGSRDHASHSSSFCVPAAAARQH